MSPGEPHLLLRLEAPLMAWGDVTFDPRRTTQRFPTRSALAGLMANALGWTYRNGDRTAALQDSLRYAARADRWGGIIRDYQTVDLEREPSGWTRWGVEKRGGGSAKETHILQKFYLADSSFLVALRLETGTPVTLGDLAAALRAPARPLYLGRRSCPPATAVLEGEVTAESLLVALAHSPPPQGDQPLRCWFPEDECPDQVPGETLVVWDHRDFEGMRSRGRGGWWS